MPDSRADPQRLYLPLIMDPIYGQAVNVECAGARSVTAQAGPDSCLRFDGSTRASVAGRWSRAAA